MKTIQELREEMNLFLGDLGDRICDYNDGYICNIISEIADNNVDIYNRDLLEWAKDNYGYIEEVVEEFGVDSKNFNFMRLIQQGQWLCNEQELYENLEDNLKNRVLDYIEKDLEIEQISEEQEDELMALDFNDHNQRLEDLLEEVASIFSEEED